MEKFIVCLFTALSTFLPSCSIENNQTPSENIISENIIQKNTIPKNIRTEDYCLNKELDNPKNHSSRVRHFKKITINSSYFNPIIQNPEKDPNIRVIPVGTINFNEISKQLAILKDYILFLDEEDCFSLQKKSFINDHNLRLVSILFYNSDMDSPYFVNINVDILNTHRLAGYSQYIPGKNTENSFYRVYLVFVGTREQMLNEFNKVNHDRSLEMNEITSLSRPGY
jgi:uncharacterized protein (UPF0147 family)